MAALWAALQFFMTPVGRLLGVGLICLSVGGVTGWRAHKKLSDLTWYKARVAVLESNIKTRDAAAKADQDKAVANAIERTKLETMVGAATNAATDRECLSPDIADRVRDFWPDGEDGRPPARSR